MSCLSRAVASSPLALREVQIKDLAKSLRSLASDKSQLIQRSAAQVCRTYARLFRPLVDTNCTGRVCKACSVL